MSTKCVWICIIHGDLGHHACKFGSFPVRRHYLSKLIPIATVYVDRFEDKPNFLRDK